METRITFIEEENKELNMECQWLRRALEKIEITNVSHRAKKRIMRWA